MAFKKGVNIVLVIVFLIIIFFAAAFFYLTIPKAHKVFELVPPNGYILGRLEEIEEVSETRVAWIVEIDNYFYRVMLDLPVEHILLYRKGHDLELSSFDSIKKGDYVFVSWESYSLEKNQVKVAKVSGIHYGETFEDLVSDCKYVIISKSESLGKLQNEGEARVIMQDYLEYVTGEKPLGAYTLFSNFDKAEIFGFRYVYYFGKKVWLYTVWVGDQHAGFFQDSVGVDEEGNIVLINRKCQVIASDVK